MRKGPVPRDLLVTLLGKTEAKQAQSARWLVNGDLEVRVKQRFGETTMVLKKDVVDQALAGSPAAQSPAEAQPDGSGSDAADAGEETPVPAAPAADREG